MKTKKFQISTAIDYPSGKPHVGHLYEKVCTDVIARFKRLQGFDVHFSTGLDEHGSKIEKKAKEAGKAPQAYVDFMSKFFLDLLKTYDISNDDFVRTTEKRHIEVVNDIFDRVNKNGDIYKGFYEGLYCPDCETFYTEKDLNNGKCVVHNKPVEQVKEESYFFKMGSHKKVFEEHIRNNKDYLLPKGKPEEILNRLKGGLNDLSISRTNVKWGIPLPIDPKHTNYVWMDALINYITTIGGVDSDKFKEFWPALHIIGTDITWHHTVIWGTILLSAGIPLPRVFVHGFINTKGQKMSKSSGNVIDPMELAKKYPTDAIRYFLVRDIPFGEDGDFSEEALIARLNGELVSDLGNLVSRILTLAEKARDNKVPISGIPKLDKKLDLGKIEEHMEKLELHLALDGAMGFVRSANKYINETEPWKKEGKELGNIIYNLLEALRVIGIITQPFMPKTSKKINEQLGVELGTLDDCKFREWNSQFKKGEHLFKKIEFKAQSEEKKKARDVGFKVTKECEKLGIKAVAAVLSGVTIKKKKGSLEKLKKATVEGFSFKNDKIAQGYRDVYERIGEKDIKHPIENLKWIVEESKKLPTINTVVDAYNVVALEKNLSIGAHDLDKVEGNVKIARTSGSEPYSPLGSDKPVMVNRGEYACMDEGKIICRMDIKQCNETKIDENTENVFIYVQGNANTSEAYIKGALKQACENIVKFCGGQYKIL